MKNKLLVVFNTSEFKHKGKNVNSYISSLQSILDQKFDNFHVIYSGFCNSKETKKKIQGVFSNKISYIYIDEIHPVQTTCNLACQKASECFGDYDIYCYIDSGVSLAGQDDIFDKMYRVYKSGPYGMVAVNVSEDSGLGLWGIQNSNQTIILDIGKTVNLHCQFISSKIYHAYNKQLFSGKFGSYCLESTFSSVCKSLGLEFAFLAGTTVIHKHESDFGSAAFETERKHLLDRDKISWNHTINSDKTIKEIIEDPEAYNSGFVYELCQRVLCPNPNAYDSSGKCKDPDRLYRFIKKNFYEYNGLDYNKIEYEFIG